MAKARCGRSPAASSTPSNRSTRKRTPSSRRFRSDESARRSGWRYRIAVGEGAIWLLAPASLWRIDSTTKRLLGSVPLDCREEGSSVATGDGAVWVATSDGIVLRVDPDSQTVAKTIPLGTLLYPADPWDPLAVGAVRSGRGHVVRFVTDSAPSLRLSGVTGRTGRFVSRRFSPPASNSRSSILSSAAHSGSSPRTSWMKRSVSVEQAPGRPLSPSDELAL